MAAGDVLWFNQGFVDLGAKVHNLGADVLKIGFVTAAVTPTVATADPRWGTGGGTNLSTNQVAVGGSYTGPITLAGVTWTLSAGGKLTATSVTIAQHASGFTNARWAIIYNDTDAGKHAIAFGDLGSDRSIVPGPLALNWNAGGVLTLTQAP